MGTEWDPWAHLTGTDLRVLWAQLPHTNGAYVADASTVILRSGLSGSEVRSALAEELAHHALGHQPVADETEIGRTELRARRWAATRLITVESLAHAISGAADWFEVAEALEVDPDLLELRVRDMSDGERAEVLRLVDGREMGL